MDVEKFTLQITSDYFSSSILLNIQITTDNQIQSFSDAAAVLFFNCLTRKPEAFMSKCLKVFE